MKCMQTAQKFTTECDTQACRVKLDLPKRESGSWIQINPLFRQLLIIHLHNFCLGVHVDTDKDVAELREVGFKMSRKVASHWIIYVVH